MSFSRIFSPQQLAVGTNFKSSVIGLKLKTEDLKSKIEAMKSIQIAYMKSIDSTIQQAADMMMKAVQSTAEVVDQVLFCNSRIWTEITLEWFFVFKVTFTMGD